MTEGEPWAPRNLRSHDGCSLASWPLVQRFGFRLSPFTQVEMIIWFLLPFQTSNVAFMSILVDLYVVISAHSLKRTSVAH